MPKPDSSRYLTFATNLLLSNFIGKYNFFMQIEIFIHKNIFFGNETNFSLNYFGNQIKLNFFFKIL